MPTLGTEVIAVRVRQELKEAIVAEALRRQLTVNGLLVETLASRFSCVPADENATGSTAALSQTNEGDS